MKPVTHTSSWTRSVGAPWEIYRVETYRGVVDVYTKAGDTGVYSSLLALIPDFGVGWVILTAADTLGHAGFGKSIIANLIVDSFVPAFEIAAKDEAASNFAGTYKATNGLNSSIALVTDGLPGLGVQSWISNGTDMFEAYFDLSGGRPEGVSLIIRLYPTNLLREKQQTFRAIAELQGLESSATNSGVFTGSSCDAWISMDGKSYGNVAVDEFLFQFDDYGRAVSMEPRTFRITLKKVV